MLAALTLNPSTIRPGGGTTATITLQGSATRRGVTVYLSSSNPQAVPTPASIVVPGGRPSASVALRADLKTHGGQVTIAASLRNPLKITANQTVAQPHNLSGQAVTQGVKPLEAVTQKAPQAVHPSVITRSIGAATETSQSSWLVTQIVNGPGDTKQAVLNVQPNVSIKPLIVPNRQLQLGK
jgi:hypothetical protein